MARYLLPVVAPAASTPAQFEALVNAALAPLLAQHILAFDLIVTDKLPAYERSFQVMIDYEDGGSPMSAPFQLRVLEAPEQVIAAQMMTDYVAANGSRYIAPAQYEYTDQLPNIQNRCLVFVVSCADAANGQMNYLASATGGGSGGGAVSSVGLSAPSIFSVSGSPVTTAGVLGLALVVQAAATFFAGPIVGAAATPAFRTIRITDLPAIPFAYLSTTPTTLAGYGITDAAPITHVGSNGSIQHAVVTTSDAGFAPILSGSASQYLNGAGAWTTPAGSGSVASVGLAAPAQFNVTGSPVTTSGTLTFAWNNQVANVAMMGPTTGGAATPTFRALVIGDLPVIPFSYITTTPTTLAGYGIVDAAPLSHVGSGGVSQHALATGSNAGFMPVLSNNALQFLNGAGAWTVPAGSGSGSVTSVALALPAAVFSISGSPVTTTGTLTGAFVNQAINVVFAGPISGGTAVPTFRALTTADLPAIPFSYITSTPTTLAGYGITDAAPIAHVGSGGVSQHAIVTTSNAGFAPVLSNVVTQFLNGQGGWTVPAGSGGTVTSVALNMPAELSVAGSPVTTSGAFTVTWASESQNTVLAAPAVGSGTPAFRLLVAADIPTIPAAGVSGLAAIATSGSAIDLTTGSIPAARYAATTIPVSAINATGTPSGTTFLRGDGAWATPAGGGGTIGGSIASTQVAVGSGANTLAGSAALVWASGTGLSANRPATTGTEAFGSGAGNTTMSGTNNTMVGNAAGTAMTSGLQNTMVGAGAGTANSTGNNNIAIGYQAMFAGTFGDDNVVIGVQAMNAVIGAGRNRNVVIGGAAFFNSTATNDAVVIGYQAGQANGAAGVLVGRSAGKAMTGLNTAIGMQAGEFTTSGISNIFLGNFAGDSTAITASNRFVVGSKASTHQPISDVYIGSGETDTNPQAVVYHATGGSGTNIAGASLTIAGGIGTGTGVGGSVRIQTAPVGSSGSTANTLVTRVTVDSAGLFVVGGSSIATSITADGSNSGPAGGASIGVKNSGVALISIGNISGIVGGAYDATPTLWTSGSFRIQTNVTVALAMTSAGDITLIGRLLSSSPSKGIGYGTGAGGTVTQSTSKSTTVSLDTMCGSITMNAASLAANTGVVFTLSNTSIVATDIVIVIIKSGGSANSYSVGVESVSTSSCNIRLKNDSGGALAEAIILTFYISKAVTS